ncbi:MAG: hypothetical protein IPK53_15660 [bacterium]|nr:hypothetical protein [bacterium]
MSNSHETVILGNPPRRFRRYLSEADIMRAVKETAARIEREYAGREPVFVGVLTGCFMFLSDIVRNVNLTCTVDSKSVRSGVEVDFISLDLPDEFVIGYGLDYAGEGRNLTDLYILDDESTL